MTNKIVRLSKPGGPCMMLGPFIKEAGPLVYYRCRAMMRAFIPRRLVHLEPCPSCEDHPRSHFSKLTIFNGYG